MVAFTITIGTKTRTKNISAASATRAAAWAAAAYAPVPNPAYPAPEGQPAVPATIPNPEPVLSAIDGTMQGVIDNVRNWEREQAKKAVPEPADLT